MADEFDQYKKKTVNPGAAQAADEFEQYKKATNLKDPAVVAPLAGRATSEALPGIMASAGAALGGGAGAIPGAVLGSALKGLARQYSPKYFGEDDNKNDPAGAAWDIAKDGITQGAFPEILGKVAGTLASKEGVAGTIANSKILRNFPAVKTSMAGKLSNQISGMVTPQVDSVEQAARNASELTEGYTPKDFKTKYSDMSAGLDRVNLNPEVAGKQAISPLANKALSDVTHARNFKLSTGEPDTLEQLALNKSIKTGFKSDGTIDPDKIINELHGDRSDVYSEAIGADTRGKLGEALSLLQKQKNSPTMDRLLHYSAGKLVLAAPAIALGGHFGGSIGAGVGGAAAAVTLTDKMLSKLMSNPETADLVLQALKTPTGAPESGFVHQLVSNGIRGLTSAASTPDK